MTTEPDIYRTANELLKQHGHEAPIFAAMRADELLEAGDIAGQAVWLRPARRRLAGGSAKGTISGARPVKRIFPRRPAGSTRRRDDDADI